MEQQTVLNQELKTELNQSILLNYGHRLVISKTIKEKDYVDIVLDYRRIIHILDSSTNTIYVRTIHFPSVFNGLIDLRKKLLLPLDEINKTIENKYIELRTNMTKNIICNKKIILPLIKQVPLFSAFLNKFNDLISALVYDDIIYSRKLTQRLESDDSYKKYLDTLISSGYAVYDKHKNLKATEKLKVLHKDLLKDNKNTTKDVIDEVMFNIIRDNYEYILHHLKLKILRTYVNLLSCLNYITIQSNIKKISMNIRDVFKIYRMFYGDLIEFKFEERINYLANAGIITKEQDIINWHSASIIG